MSRTFELPDDVYAQLEAEESAAGTTPAEWIAARVAARRRRREPQANGPGSAARTLADEFAGRIGLVSSGRSDLSERVSEIFAEGLLEKRRTETL